MPAGDRAHLEKVIRVRRPPQAAGHFFILMVTNILSILTMEVGKGGESLPLHRTNTNTQGENMEEKKPRKPRNSNCVRPESIEEARKMGRVKAVYMAPLYGMTPGMLRRRCVKGEVKGAVKIGQEWYVAPEGMDALFSPKKSRK
jgi:hypothetical protein